MELKKQWTGGIFIMLMLTLTGCATIGLAQEATQVKLHWMPLSDDQEYLNDVLQYAHDKEIDGFQISHNLLHSIDEIVYPDRERDMISTKIDKDLLVDFVSNLDKNGYEVHFWTHEIVGPPAEAVRDGKVIVDHPSLRAHTLEKYKLAEGMLPTINSIVVTLFETEYKVFDDDEATMLEGPGTAVSRTVELLDIMSKTCAELKVPLVLRGNFLQSDEIFRSLDGNFVFMVKNTETDWHPYAPLNDFITTDIAKKYPVWVEFDAGYEYEMRNTVPFGEPSKILDRLKISYKHGVRTFAIRLDRYGGKDKASAIYTPWGQLALQVFTEFKKNPKVELTDVISTWEAQHFPGAYELTTLSTEIVKTLLFPKKMWYASHSSPPKYEYAQKHILPRDGFGFAQESALNRNISETEAIELLKNSYAAHEPDLEFYESILHDLENISPKYERITELMAENAEFINSHPIWSQAIERLQDWKTIFELHQKIYFGLRLNKYHPGSIADTALEKLIDSYENELSRIRSKYEDVEGSQIGAILWNTDKSVTEFREALSTHQ